MALPFLSFLVVPFGYGYAAEPPIETVGVVVARKDIPAGSIIDQPEKLFKVVRYVKGDEPRGGFTDLRKLDGQFLTGPLAEDQPVKQKDLVWLPNGLRAYSIR